jgi:hypothetical protein
MTSGSTDQLPASEERRLPACAWTWAFRKGGLLTTLTSLLKLLDAKGLYRLATRLAKSYLWVLSLDDWEPYLETRLNRKLRKSPPFPRRRILLYVPQLGFDPSKIACFSALRSKKTEFEESAAGFAALSASPFREYFGLHSQRNTRVTNPWSKCFYLDGARLASRTC